MPRIRSTGISDRRFYAGPTFFDVVKAPYRLGWAFLLAWVFCVFYLQVFGIPSGDILIASGKVSSGLTLFFNAFPVFVSVATLMTVIATERKFGSPSTHPGIEVASPAIAAIGTPLLLLDAGDVGTTAFIYGIASLLTGVGSGVMWISWGEHYARIPQEDVELFAPASAVLSALLTLAVSAMSGWVSVAVVASFPLLSSLCLLTARKEDEPHDARFHAIDKNAADSASHTLAIPSSMGRTVAGILVACLFVCVAGALVEDWSAFGNSGIQIALVASIAFTLAIAIASIVGPRRISISFFYRWMCPALVLGFAAIVLFGEQIGSYLAFAMSISARFAFCLITQMYFARVASEGRLTAVQAYGWGWISVHLGDFLGVVAAMLFSSLIAGNVIDIEQVAAGSMVMLVVATMFVIDDKRSFASPNQTNAPADADPNVSSPEAVIAPGGNGSTEKSNANADEAAGGEVRKTKIAAANAPNADTASANPSAGDLAAGASTDTQAPALDRRIELVAEECGLTPRECEVLALLARGRSIPYVRDALVISRETAATHAKHIYAKLGVHSRQELIDLVAGIRTDR